MGLSVAILLITMFSVFMYTAEGVTDESKTVTLVIIIAFVLFLIFGIFF